MLREFRLQNFKSYRDGTLPLATLTLLIGANASGKSNALEGLRFFSWLAQDNRLANFVYAPGPQLPEIRGGITSLTYRNEPSFSLGCSLDESQEDWGKWCALDTNIQLYGELDDLIIFVNHERVYDPGSGQELYVAEQVNLDHWPDHEFEAFFDEYGDAFLKVEYRTFSPTNDTPVEPIYLSDEKPAFLQLTTPSLIDARFDQERYVIPAVAKRFQQALVRIVFLDLVPSRMRTYSGVAGRKRLRADGSNLSGVLYQLCQQSQGLKKTVLDFVRALPEQDVEDLDFLIGPKDEVLVQLVEMFGEHREKRDASVLSDGTLRVLAIAAALLSAQPETLIVIEEIENGVHPARAQHLLQLVQRVAKERRLQVLATTHNPALLDALPLSSVPHVVACYRDPQAGHSCLVRLGDLLSYPELVAQGALGNLVTEGILERYLKQQQTEEERRTAALAWLEELAGEVEEQ